MNTIPQAGRNGMRDGTRPYTKPAGNTLESIIASVDPDQVNFTEVILVLLLLDDSSSIERARNTDLVIAGHNAMLEALRDAKAAKAILVACAYFNGKVFYPFVPLSDAPQMTATDYRPAGLTPLYQTAYDALGLIEGKVRDLTKCGINASSGTCIVTDGKNEDPAGNVTVEQVEGRITPMQDSESHRILGMGLSGGPSDTDFKQIFNQMGIPDKAILTPEKGMREVRAAFGAHSRSLIEPTTNTTLGRFGASGE